MNNVMLGVFFSFGLFDLWVDLSHFVHGLADVDVWP